MIYESTRDINRKINPSEAILQGLSEEGGLFVLRDLGKNKLDFKNLVEKNYYEVAEEVLKLFVDFNEQEFDSTLKTAQELGYAEADPSADIDGGDVINKIILSNALAFDIHIEPNFPTYSMRNITKNDIDYLKKYDYAVKYIGETNVANGKYETSVMLSVFDKGSQEAAVELNNNIITLDGSFIGELKFYGQGAGKLPTGNAIVQDIVDIYSNIPRKDVVIKNELVQSNELTSKKYLLRASFELGGELIESIEKYENEFYSITKEISLSQLSELTKKLEGKDDKYLVAKFH